MALLPALCAALVWAALLVYVITAGLDLGVGLLSLIAPRARDRTAMLESLAPVWYGSSVWLAFGACVLAAAFPAGVSLLGALWPWLALMLLALSVRGASYALRHRLGGSAPALSRACEVAFGLASGLVIICQGFALGAVLSGVPETGGPFGLALMLGLLCAFGLIGAYVLLGAGWLIERTPGAVQTFGREVGHAAVILTAGAMILACVWAILIGAPVARCWTVWPGMALPLASLAAIVCLEATLWRGLWSDAPERTFRRAIVLVLIMFAGLVASLLPVIASGVDLPGGKRGTLALQFTLFDAALTAPVLLACLLHAVRLLRLDPMHGGATPSETPKMHVGRRPSSLKANTLHLS